MFNPKKSFTRAIIFISIFTILIVIIEFFFNTKIYKNDKFGFEFQYDGNSKISYEIKNDHAFINGKDMGPASEGDVGVFLKLENDDLVVTRNEDKNTDDVSYLDVELINNCDFYYGKKSEKVFNGLTFKYIEAQNAIEGKGFRRTACISRNGKNFALVNISFNNENLQKTARLFNQTLSTFKFTK